MMWEWGVKEVVQEDATLKYLVTRKPSKKEVCELKYELIRSVLQNEGLRAMVPPEPQLQLKAYLAEGVYGEKAKATQPPEYATKSSS